MNEFHIGWPPFLNRRARTARDSEGLVCRRPQAPIWASSVTATVRTMIAAGATHLVECGPGKVLTSLNRRVDKNRDLKMLALEDPQSLEEALAELRI